MTFFPIKLEIYSKNWFFQMTNCYFFPLTFCPICRKNVSCDCLSVAFCPVTFCQWLFVCGFLSVTFCLWLFVLWLSVLQSIFVMIFQPKQRLLLFIQSKWANITEWFKRQLKYSYQISQFIWCRIYKLLCWYSYVCQVIKCKIQL